MAVTADAGGHFYDDCPFIACNPVLGSGGDGEEDRVGNCLHRGYLQHHLHRPHLCRFGRGRAAGNFRILRILEVPFVHNLLTGHIAEQVR